MEKDRKSGECRETMRLNVGEILEERVEPKTKQGRKKIIVGCELLLVLVLLGAVLQDPREFDVVEQIALDGRLAVHLVDLRRRILIILKLLRVLRVPTHVLVGEAVAHGGEQLAEAILRDVPVVVLVEAAEGVLDDVLRVGALQALAKQREEHREVDRAGRLVHHRLEVVIGRVLAQRRQHVVQIFLLDETVAVLIDHVERFLKIHQN